MALIKTNTQRIKNQQQQTNYEL